MGKKDFTFDAVIGPPINSGFTDNGNAVCIEFDGMIRDVRGRYTAAVLTPALPTVVGMLLAHAEAAQAALAASGTKTPKPLALQCSDTRVEDATEAGLHVVLQLAPDVNLHVDFSRDAAQALYQELANRLAS